MRISIIIRTLNEARYLGELLESIHQQNADQYQIETIIVDSGSTDQTLSIAGSYGCKVVHIEKEYFSFGRSLNFGCDAANGELLVIISGHCVPNNNDWLRMICNPLKIGSVEYVYGKQIGGESSYFSENQIFKKYYSDQSRIPQSGFFCNNANSAILKSTWDKYRFDENVTGLEDMELAERVYRDGGKIGYVSEACVFHYHSETWKQVKRRFEREAIALQKFMPQIHVRIRDLVRYIFKGVMHDWKEAFSKKVFLEKSFEIVQYRVCQYYGSYVGNQQHRILSDTEKEKYFYPDHSKFKEKEINDFKKTESRRAVANESQQ